MDRAWNPVDKLDVVPQVDSDGGCSSTSGDYDGFEPRSPNELRQTEMVPLLPHSGHEGHGVDDQRPGIRHSAAKRSAMSRSLSPSPSRFLTPSGNLQSRSYKRARVGKSQIDLLMLVC